MVSERVFTLKKNEKFGSWDLSHESSNALVRRFSCKGDATKGGVIERLLSPLGGIVKVQKRSGELQAARVYPALRTTDGSEESDKAGMPQR